MNTLDDTKKAVAAAKAAVAPAPVAAAKVKYNGPGSWKTIVMQDGSEVPIGSPHGQAILGTAPAPAKKTDAAGASFSPAESANRVPMYMPMGTRGKRPDGSDPFPLFIVLRKWLLQDWIGQGAASEKSPQDKVKDPREMTDTTSSIAAIYEYKFWAMVCLVITLVSYFVNIYVAGVFAYLTGHFWSERLVANAWGVEWFKGKLLVHTK